MISTVKNHLEVASRNNLVSVNGDEALSPPPSLSLSFSLSLSLFVSLSLFLEYCYEKRK